MKKKQDQNSEENKTVSTFPSKWAKKLKDMPEGWMESVESMNLEELKKKLVEYERTISSSERDKENDAKLASQKEEVKRTSDLYDDVIKVHQAMIKFVVHVIDGRGTP